MLVKLSFKLFITTCLFLKVFVTEARDEYNSVLDVIIDRGVLRVGTTSDFVPFSYFPDANSELSGIDINMAMDLGNALGVNVEIVNTTWSTLTDDLLTKRFDIGMSGITIDLERQKKALFSVPSLAGGKATITRVENAAKYQTIYDINQPNVRIITNTGGTNEAFDEANFPNATIVLNMDNLDVFDQIVDGDVDLMVTDAIETLVQEIIQPELKAVNPNDPFNFFEYGYIMNRDHTFKAYVDQWLNLRLKDGTYQSIYNAEMDKITAANPSP